MPAAYGCWSKKTVPRRRRQKREGDTQPQCRSFILCWACTSTVSPQLWPELDVSCQFLPDVGGCDFHGSFWLQNGCEFVPKITGGKVNRQFVVGNARIPTYGRAWVTNHYAALPPPPPSSDHANLVFLYFLQGGSEAHQVLSLFPPLHRSSPSSPCSFSLFPADSLALATFSSAPPIPLPFLSDEEKRASEREKEKRGRGKGKGK